jgi:uncharacterized protein (TIRG00374 family)
MGKTASKLLQISKFFVTVGIVYFIIQKLGWENIVDNISNAKISWLVVAILGFFVSIILGAFQWRIILKTKGLEISVRRAIFVYMTGIFINNFMFGMIAGDAYKVGALQIGEKAGTEALASTFLDRLAGLMVISIFAVVGGAVLIMNSNDASQPIFYTVAAISLFASIFVSIFFLLISKRLQKFSLKMVDILPWDSIKDKLSSLLKQFFIDRHKPEEKSMLMSVLSLSLLIQAIRVGVHILAAIALGILSASQIHYFFIIIPVTALMMIIPLPLGVKESVAGFLFGMAGFQLDESISMEFLATIIGITASLFGGVTFLLESSKRD